MEKKRSIAGDCLFYGGSIAIAGLIGAVIYAQFHHPKPSLPVIAAALVAAGAAIVIGDSLRGSSSQPRRRIYHQPKPTRRNHW